METRVVAVELPTSLVDRVGSVEALTDRARRALVLDLLREVDITQGEAALLLGVTRYNILDLMVHERIPAGPPTAAGVDDESEVVGRLAAGAAVGAGGQR